MEQKQIIVIAVVAVVALAAIGGGVALLAGKNNGGGETQYTLTYNVNGGTAIDSFKFTKSTETFALATPAWDAEHTFLGWYDNQAFTGSPVTQVIKGTERNIEVWAKWQVEMASLPTAGQMSSNTAINSTLGAGATVEQKTVPTDVVNAITAGKTLTVNNVDNTGKTTLAWTFNGADSKKEGYGGAAVNTNVVPNTTELASEKKITLAFDYSGKLPYDSTIKYYVGTEYAGQNISVKNNADPNPLGEYEVDPQGYISFTIDHCSDWVLTICYVVTFDPARATISSVPDGWELVDGYYAKKFPFGTPMTVVEQDADDIVCVKTGYYISSYEKSSLNVLADGTSRITAVWSPITYTIEFDKNLQDATGTMASSLRTYDAPEALPTVAFASETAAFLGWATSADGPVVYNDTAVVSNLTDVKDSTVRLYAKWGANNFTVSISLDGVPDANKAVSIQKESAQPIALTYTPSIGAYFCDVGIEKNVVYKILIDGADTGYAATTTNGTGSYNFVRWTVSFVTSYGSVDPQIVDNDQKVSDPNLSRTGYQAPVWKNAQNVAWNFINDPVTNTMVLTANWTPNEYAITFATDGGSAVAGVTATFDSDMPRIVPPTKTGYTLQGFFYNQVKYYNADGTSAHAWDVASAAELTAQWTVNTYTISFETNGGSAVAPVTVEYGHMLPAITPPTKEGYTLVEFVHNGAKYYNADGTPYAAWTVASDATMYANWTGRQYTITYDISGGTGDIANKTATYGSAMPTIVAPTKAGYDLVGFFLGDVMYYGADGSSARNWDVTNDATLVARWGPQMFTVTIALDGGDVNLPRETTWSSILDGYTKRFENGTTVATILQDFGATPAKDYYTFTAWSPNSGAIDAAPLTITAQYSAIEYTIVYNTEGGSGTVASTTKTYGETLTMPEYSGTKLGFNFAGNWSTSVYVSSPVFTDGSCQVNTTLLVWAENNTITLHAMWDAIDYTVHFDVNTGTGTVPDDMTRKRVGGSINLEVPNATKADKFFGGWNTKADGTGTNYLSGNNEIDASFVEFAVGTTVTLYANWTEGVYTATVGDRFSLAVTSDTREGSMAGTLDNYVIWANAGTYELEYIAGGLLAGEFDEMRYETCEQGFYPYIFGLDADTVEYIRTNGQYTEGTVSITVDGVQQNNIPVRIYTATIVDPYDSSSTTYVYKEDANGTGYAVEVTMANTHGTAVLQSIETAAYRHYTESTVYDVTYYNGIERSSTPTVMSSHTYKTPQELGMQIPEGKVFAGWSWTNDAGIVSTLLTYQLMLGEDMFLKTRHAASGAYTVYAVWADYTPPATNIDWTIYNWPEGLEITIDGNDAIASNGTIGHYITFSGASNWVKEDAGGEIVYSFTIDGIQYFARVQTVVSTIYGTFANVADDSDGNTMRIRFLELGTHDEEDYYVDIVFWQEDMRLKGYVPTVDDSFTYTLSNGDVRSWRVTEIDPPARGESGEYMTTDDYRFYYYEYPYKNNQYIRYIDLATKHDCVYTMSSYRFDGGNVTCWHVTSTEFRHYSVGSVGHESTTLGTSAYYGVNDGLLYYYMIPGYSDAYVSLTSKTVAGTAAPCADVTYNGNGGLDYMYRETFVELKDYDADDYEYSQAFRKEGYNMIGWNTRADGSGRTYHARDTFNPADIAEDNTLTLYVMWEFSGAYIDITAEGAEPSRLIQIPEDQSVVHYTADSGLTAPSGKAAAFYRFSPYGETNFVYVKVRVLPVTGWSIDPQGDGTYKISMNGSSGYTLCEKMADRDVYYHYNDYSEISPQNAWRSHPTIFACGGTSVPLTVVWDDSPLTLTYHANDGSGRTADKIVPSVDHASYRFEGDDLFARANYELIGWCFSEVYDEEKTVPVEALLAGAATIKMYMDEWGSSDVYAVWKAT